MTRWVYVDGDDHTDQVRLDDLQLVESAYGCDVGQGGFDRDDAALGAVPAMKQVVVLETDATPTRMFTGYVSQRGLARGPLPKVEDQRQFDVQLLDLNTLWDDPVLEGTDANRPEETDYARMVWLIGTDEFAALGIAAGVVPNTNTANLDKRDYRGEHPRVVAEECMEAASKNAFLYDYGSGPLVYYDLATGTSLSSTARITSVLADVDESADDFAVTLPTLLLDPDRIYSKVRFEYAGGHVTVEDAGTEAAFRARAIRIQDDTVKGSTKATNKANKYLARSDSELHKFACSVSLPAASVNLIRAGQRIQVKIPHLTTDDLDLSDWTWMRISRRTVLPQRASRGAVGDRYTLVLEFADDLLPAGFGRTGPGGDTAETGDGAAVTLARYQLSQEIGSGPFGPAAGLWDQIDPGFAFGSISAAVDGIIDRTPEGNISWPFTDCGVGTGGVAGLENRSVWHRFTVDLSDETIVGVRFTVLPFLVAGSGYTESPGGFLVGDGTVSCGIHTGASSTGAEIDDQNDYVEVGRVGDQGGVVFVPVSLLIDVADGYNWFVLAPGWAISSGLFFCNSAANHPFGYGLTGHDSNATSIVSGVEVTAGGSGTSPWLPAIGDVDGSNQDFSLPLWNGEGVPELRVGAIVLGAGEYTYDGDTKVATITPAPPDELDGQVAYRAPMG